MFFPHGSPAILTLGSTIENEAEDDEEDEYDTHHGSPNSLPNGGSAVHKSTSNNNGISDSDSSTVNGPGSASKTSKISSILVVCSNRERLIVAVLTLKTLFLYSANPQTLLVAYTRSKKSLAEKGFNERLIWKPDSTSIAITVTFFVSSPFFFCIFC